MEAKEGQILEERVLFQGKWLSLYQVDTKIGEKVIKNYEVVKRTTHIDKPFDGVTVIPIVKFKEKKSHLLLISQYRPPINQFCLEFPAGLIEDGETLLDCCRREVKEETGYTIDRLIGMPGDERSAPVVHISPWISKQTSVVYLAIIDGDAEENQNLKQSLDPAEVINLHTVEIDETLPSTVKALADKLNLAIEEKVWSFAVGFGLTKSI
eukprot:TRINITY_DN11643_c0_g1_i2.p1 TRINITY_DN11643_c0_g1~~TRINITY_DN11643_c0_g1_i2.p1  ORF type:complete len:210 (+),score=56.19 TRINITY_DN11643_c0_g1_i2:200-829(+)